MFLINERPRRLTSAMSCSWMGRVTEVKEKPCDNAPFIFLYLYPAAGIMVTVLEKGKPAARRGRKATGLPEEEAAGLPKGYCW
jgi:hypothetical protein